MYKPKLDELAGNVEMLTHFKGYENKFVIDENAFLHTQNMTADYYPVISPRNKRLIFETEGDDIQCLASKDRIIYIKDGKLYYMGKHIIRDFTFPEISTERHFVSMGSKFLVFPDKFYFNTDDLSDYGNLENHFVGEWGTTCAMCKADGELYGEYTVGKTKPANPENGDLWFDTSKQPNALKQYSETEGMWFELSETYIRITCEGVNEGFRKYDGVSIIGLEDMGIEGEHLIKDLGTNYLVISGVMKKAMSTDNILFVSRDVPDMDFVCESGNRIWGCSSSFNEIYASKLGDPTNFSVYMGLSTDSYAASVGTDGNFTAAISFKGYVMFFKENCVHKIYGQNPPYSITTSFIRGVQKKCHKSLVCLNETLYYKSLTGICAYEGGVPINVSADLGDEYYYDAVAGVCGNKYYICMTDTKEQRHLFVYDEEKNTWYREDNTDIREFATNHNNLYFVTCIDDKYKIGIIDGIRCHDSFASDLRLYKLEDDFEWGFETGLWGLYLPENKYYSNIIMRASGSKGAKIKVYFQFNSDGVWHKKYESKIEKTGSFILPFITPRCDHMRMKVEGKGDVKILSISRKVQFGSELNV